MLQPLDKRLFSSLKAHWRNECHSHSLCDLLHTTKHYKTVLLMLLSPALHPQMSQHNLLPLQLQRWSIFRHVFRIQKTPGVLWLDLFYPKQNASLHRAGYNGNISEASNTPKNDLSLPIVTSMQCCPSQVLSGIQHRKSGKVIIVQRAMIGQDSMQVQRNIRPVGWEKNEWYTMSRTCDQSDVIYCLLL